MPLPEVVHCPVVVNPITLPDRLITLLAHIVTLGPASTIGEVVIVTIIVSDTGIQFPLLVETKVSVTVPAEISAGLGV